MKKYSLVFLLAISINASAQIEKPTIKGNIMLSGGGTIAHIKNSSSTIGLKSSFLNVVITPGFSYFVLDNFSIGLNTNLRYSGLSNNKYYTLGVGPNIRYYISDGLFLSAEAGYNYQKRISNANDYSKYISFKPGIGYSFFLNSKVSFDPGIYYELVKYDYHIEVGPDSYQTSTFMLELKVSIFL